MKKSAFGSCWNYFTSLTISNSECTTYDGFYCFPCILEKGVIRIIGRDTLEGPSQSVK